VNIIYLFIHNKLLKKYNEQRILKNEQVKYVICSYLRFIPKKIREKVFKEMILEGALIKVSRDKVRISNPDSSVKIDQILEGKDNGKNVPKFWYDK